MQTVRTFSIADAGSALLVFGPFLRGIVPRSFSVFGIVVGGVATGDLLVHAHKVRGSRPGVVADADAGELVVPPAILLSADELLSLQLHFALDPFEDWRGEYLAIVLENELGDVANGWSVIELTKGML